MTVSDRRLEGSLRELTKKISFQQLTPPCPTQLGRPVVHDGAARGRSPKVMAEAAISCPKIYRNVAFEEALPPITPPPKPISAPHGDKRENNDDDGRSNRDDGETTDGVETSSEASVEGFEGLVSGNKGYRYNIDVVPKINLSKGPLIKALLKSGVGRYLEFMPLKYTYLHQHSKEDTCPGSLQRVPMSKADIFQTKSISPIEKRLLMKFMQW